MYAEDQNHHHIKMHAYSRLDTIRPVWPAKNQISVCSRTVWSESLLITCLQQPPGYPKKNKWEHFPKWVDVQADLNLCWSHRSYCRFYHALAHITLIWSMFGVVWVRQRCHVSCVTWVSNWYWLTVGQGLLSLKPISVEGECYYFFCFFTFSHVPLSPLPLSFISSTISSIFLLFFCGRQHKMTHKVSTCR